MPFALCGKIIGEKTAVEYAVVELLLYTLHARRVSAIDISVSITHREKPLHLLLFAVRTTLAELIEIIVVVDDACIEGAGGPDERVKRRRGTGRERQSLGRNALKAIQRDRQRFNCVELDWHMELRPRELLGSSCRCLNSLKALRSAAYELLIGFTICTFMLIAVLQMNAASSMAAFEFLIASCKRSRRLLLSAIL